MTGTLRTTEPVPAPTWAKVVYRTVRGVFFVSAGQVFLYLSGLIGTVILARLLSPADFGVYAVISFLVLKTNALAEFGLGARLVYDAETPTDARLRAVFTLHLLFAGLAYVLVYLAAPHIAFAFGLQAESVALCRVLALLLLLQPFRAIPSVLLTRRLHYDRLTAVDVIDGVTYQASACLLAFATGSVWSFGLAALISTFLSTVALNVISRWRPGFAWDSAYLGRCLRFGGAFQLSSLTAIARDNAIIILAGPFFGPSAVGFLNWALRLAWVCTQTFVAICVKVAFPSLSRLREDRRLFATALLKMLRYLNLITFLALSVTAALAPEIVRFVFTDKWMPAVPLFYCFAIRMVAGNYTTIFDLGLKALGRPDRSLWILSLWTVWEWILAIGAAIAFGYFGIALSGAVAIWLALYLLYRELSHHVSMELVSTGTRSLVAAVVTFVAISVVKTHLAVDGKGLLVAFLVGIAIYCLAAFVVGGRALVAELSADIKNLLPHAQFRAVSLAATADRTL